MVNVIKLAIPFFFILMAFELLMLWRQNKLHFYRVTDTINDLSCGITQQIADIFMKLLLFGLGYNYIQQNLSIQTLFRIPDVPNHWFVWVTLFVALDFVYYWFHRHSHEIALFWASHVVHHQSEEYNLAVALRQSVFQQFFSWFYYIGFAFLGVPFEMWFFCMGINLLYQFWIHTRAVGKLGFLELFMNTPSHHRVHHGKDPKYCDKNHAGVFIIWDKMFGTFQEEEEEPTYGITVPLNSWNPIWANLGSYQSLFKEVYKAPGIKNKLGVLFHKPGWRPKEVGKDIVPVEVDKKNYVKYETYMPKSITVYVVVHFLIALLGTTQLLELAEGFFNKPFESQLIVYGGSFLALLTLNNLGGIMEKKSWAYTLEILRIASISFGLLGLGATDPQLLFLGIVASAIFAMNIFGFRKIWNESEVKVQLSTPYSIPLE